MPAMCMAVKTLPVLAVSSGCPNTAQPRVLSQTSESQSDSVLRRRALLQQFTLAAVAAAAVGQATACRAALAPAGSFVQTASGLLVEDISEGTGRQPQPGDRVVVHWAGRTKNYQAKRIDNTSLRDEPFDFILGAGQVIPAFEEAVEGMLVGGIRRVEVLGELPELSYPRDRSKRFVSGTKNYTLGPQPAGFDGQRALDFVLDNPTLAATNRTLLFDIKLLGAYSP